MTPPRLNRQITIEDRSTSVNSSTGDETVTWTPIAYVPGSPAVAAKFWAEVQDVPPSRGEFLAQGVPVGRILTRIRMRWRDDVTSDMRVVVHGDSDVTYQIVGGPAEWGGRKQYVEFTAERYST